MASLCGGPSCRSTFNVFSALHSKPIPAAFHRPASCSPQIHSFVSFCHTPLSTTRFRNATRLQLKGRFLPAFASNSNTSDEDASKDKPHEARGPPFLTILAAFLVFILISWVFWSIIMWLFGLIVNVPPLK